MINSRKIKKDFPILKRKINGKPLVYLDNAATSQKPTQVIETIKNYYENHNANVHRGVHTLSEEATDLYESARKKVADFINANNASEVVFTGGTTESLNTIAFGWVEKNLELGDIIIFCEADHHSNIVPWQISAERTGAELKILKNKKDGLFNFEEFERILDSKKDKVKFISISHASNVLGTVYPVKRICKLIKEKNPDIIVSVDGAQAIPHMKVSVWDLGCDFYSFSSHKMLGPMGIGVLWGKQKVLEQTNPFEYGGGMISTVTINKASWADIPQRFEAGTPNVVGAVGLAEAIRYLEDVGMEEVLRHEKKLAQYAVSQLSKIDGLRVLGPKNFEDRLGLVSFVVDNIHPHDLSAILAEQAIAVRSGHHCAMPLHDSLSIGASTRASFYIYNSKKDIKYLVDNLKKAISFLK